MPAKITYEDYLRLALAKKLRLLNRADELPPDLNHTALWQCLVTGEIFARTWQQIKHRSRAEKGEYASPGQAYWAKHRENYYKLAAEFGIIFLYEEGIDLAPQSSKTPCKWRGKTLTVYPAGGGSPYKESRVVVAAYHELAYGQIRADRVRDLGLVTTTIYETDAPLEESEKESTP